MNRYTGLVSMVLLIPAAGHAQSLTVTAPLDGSSVADRSVIVRGSTSIGATVSINGTPVATFDSATTRDFAVLITLGLGANGIQVSAVLAGGPPVTQVVNVTSTAVTPFSVDAMPADGLAPLKVQFRAVHYQPETSARVEIDFDSDGQTDVSRDGEFDVAYKTYDRPGIYTATFRLTGTSGTTFTYAVPITAAPSATAAASAMAVWNGFRAALLADDANGAITFLSDRAAAQFGPALQQLDGQLADLANSLSAPQFLAQKGSLHEYVVTRTIDGTPRAFFVYFADVKGLGWRITSF